MITWMTRMSYMDTADDLKFDQLAVQVNEGQGLFEALCGLRDVTPEQKPASLMWAGYETALAVYLSCLHLRLVRHGVNPGITPLENSDVVRQMRNSGEDMTYVPPPWLKDTDVLRSHRSNLARRWPEQYAASWRGAGDDLPYIWPVVDGEGGYKLVLSKSDKLLLKSGERTLPKSIRERIENL